MDMDERLARLKERRQGPAEPNGELPECFEVIEDNPIAELDLISADIRINERVTPDQQIALESFLPPGKDYSKPSIALEAIDGFKLTAIISTIAALIGAVIGYFMRSFTTPDNSEKTTHFEKKAEKALTEYTEKREEVAKELQSGTKEIEMSANLIQEAKHLLNAVVGMPEDEVSALLKDQKRFLEYFLESNKLTESIIENTFKPLNYRILVQKEYLTSQNELVTVLTGLDSQCMPRLEFVSAYCEQISSMLRGISSGNRNFVPQLKFDADLGYIRQFLGLRTMPGSVEELAVNFKGAIGTLFMVDNLPPNTVITLDMYKDHYRQLQTCHEIAGRFRGKFKANSKKPTDAMTLLRKDIQANMQSAPDDTVRRDLGGLLFEVKEELACLFAISQAVELVHKSCEAYLIAVQRVESRYLAATRFIDRLSSLHAKTKEH